MSWIALKMLTGDKSKFFGIVLGLTFAALLITQQGSIFCGLMSRTAGQVFDIRGADLWVMDPNVRFIDDVKPMMETNLYRVRGVPGVLWAVPLYKGNARAKLVTQGFAYDPETGDPIRDARGDYKRRTDEVIEQVILLGLDDGSLVGAPPPSRILAGRLADLRRPEAVIVDFTRLRKLYPGENWALLKHHGKPVATLDRADRERFEFAYGRVPTGDDGKVNFYAVFLGRELEMNDRRAVICGVCEATRTFQSNAVMYTTYSRAKLFVPRERKLLSFVLAKTDPSAVALPPPPTDFRSRLDAFVKHAKGELTGQPEPDPVAKEVARRIESQTGLRARTSQEFIWDTIGYFMKYTGIPINFGITAALGFIVGTAIAGQTFYLFTVDNLKQFGALKAMGATNIRIVKMILLQAVVVGLLGYGIGVGLAAYFGESSKGGELAFYTPWQLLPITAAAVVFICVLSSILCIRKVIVLEPAVVFRG